MRTKYPSRVLVVDDDPGSRSAVAKALALFGHEVETAADALEAQARLRLGVSLVVADADMPGMDGFDLTRRVREEPDWADIPVLMVTGLEGRQHRLRAVEAGVSDFVAKPWDLAELYLRSEALLRTKTAVDALKRERADLEAEVARRTQDLRNTIDELAGARRHAHQAHLDAIRLLVHAAEYKDIDTGAHIDRMRWYADLVARSLGLPPRQVELIREAAPMHDVGKIGIPDSILLKPGPLTADERSIMERHTEIGARILGYADADVLRMGQVIAQSHHERWDGKGYPAGLAGMDIPLPARICAVADVFDALTVDRCYRAALSNDQVVRMLRAERGKQFDPDVLDAFLDHFREVERIQEAHRGGALEARIA